MRGFPHPGRVGNTAGSMKPGRGLFDAPRTECDWVVMVAWLSGEECPEEVES